MSNFELERSISYSNVGMCCMTTSFVRYLKFFPWKIEVS
jgi:hypothetical protein